MPSILQQQLQQVSSTWGTSSGQRQRGKPSLLYTAQEAADVDLQTLFELAQEGFLQLCGIEPRLEQFQNTLFSQGGLETNRDERTKAENAAMDASICAYLRLMTDHFLSVAAFQTLEYLIRRFRINEYNVNALIACGLPYHATNHFVRLVQILHIEQTSWRFLSPMQRTGAAMPRALLVQRCRNDQAVLMSICEAAKAVSTDASASGSMQSFYAVLLCELLLGTHPVKEDLVRLLVPYLLAGLGPDITADYRAASLMILTQLGTQATLSDTLLTGLLQEMLQHVPRTQSAQAVMVLCYLALTQPQLKLLPKSVFKRVMKLPDLVDHLRGLADKGMALGPLLALLLPPLGTSISDKKLYAKTALSMVKTLPLGVHAQLFATALLGKLPSASEEQKASLTPVVRSLDLLFPDQMDAAVNQLLQQGQDGEHASDNGMFQVLQSALAGSAHAPLLPNGTTLALAVDAPSAEMRIAMQSFLLADLYIATPSLKQSHQTGMAQWPMHIVVVRSHDTVMLTCDATSCLEKVQLALKGLDAAQQAGGTVDADPAATAEQAAFVQGAVLRRLADMDASVVDAVLSLPSLHQLPEALLFPGLAAVLDRFDRLTGLNSDKSRHKAWRSVAKKTLRRLSTFAHSDSPLKQRAVLLLLQHSIALGRTHTVAAQAVKSLQSFEDELFTGLAAVSTADEDNIRKLGMDAGNQPPGTNSPESAHELAPTTPNRTTNSDKAANIAFNQAIIHALASQLAGAQPQRLAYAQDLVLAADSFQHARHLLLLALLQACHLSAKPAGVAAAILKVIGSKWGDVIESGTSTGPAPVAVVDGSGVPTAAHYTHWERKAGKAHAAVVQQALLAALRCASAQDLQLLDAQMETHSFLTSLLLLEPKVVFQPHCTAFLDKTAAPSLSLSDIFGAASAEQALQVSALRLLQPYLTAPSAALPSPVLLPRLLAAAASSSQPARGLALDCLLAAASHPELAEHGLVNAELFGGNHLQAFLHALALHHEDIKGDSLGLLQVVRRLLPECAGKARAARHGHAHKAGSHALDSRHSASVVHYMLEVIPELHDNSSISAASLLLHILTSSAAPAQLLQAAVALLNKLPLTDKPSAAPSGSQMQLACGLLQSFTAEAFQALPKGKGKAAAVSPIVAGLEVLLRLVRFGATQGDGQPTEMLRLAAFKQLGAELYAVMPVQQQMETFLELLNGSSRDPSAAVRQAARAALSELPLTALSLRPLFTISDQAELRGEVDTPAHKTRRRSKAESSIKQAAEGLDLLELAGEASGLDLCTSVLELLQWKADIQDEAELLAPLTQVLQQLLSSCTPAGDVPSGPSPTGMDTSDDESSSNSEDDAEQHTPQRSSHHAYSLALALQAVQNIAERASDAWLKTVDMGLVVQCAKEAPDSAVRNAALTLLAVLATKLPDSALQHVLEVVSVVGSTASQQEDTHSHQVAAAALGAIAPAWLRSGKPISQLVAAVVALLPAMLPHRRLPILTALLAVLPQDAARPTILLLLLQQALQLSPEEPSAASQVSLQPESKQKQEEPWPVALATSVCHQAPLQVRVESLTALLQQAVEQSKQRPQSALPSLSVTFATAQVQEDGAGLSASRTSTKAQSAYAALLEQAVSQLQLLGGETGGSTASRKAHQAAQDRLYGLLEALAQVMQGGAYVAALLRLCRHSSEAVIRRALKLITTSVAKLSLQEQPDTQEAEADPAAASGTADAALELCALAPSLLQTGKDVKQLSASTRQAALVAVSTLGQALGQSRPQSIIAVLPALVAAAQDVHRSIRSSALAAAAACLAALGPQALPLLPKLVPAVIAAAEAAVDGLAVSSPLDPEDAAEMEDDETSSEGAALEAAAALAAVAALVDGLQAFLSPHLSALLHLLFSPAVLACHQADCSQTAGSIRIQLAGVMPARLLLGPLFGHFDGAVQEGEAATVSLLAMAQRTIEQMDPTTAAQHADLCFTFLLRALDLRQKRPTFLPVLQSVEQGSVGVLLALTMKLSEAKFKPLFLRLLDWGATPPAAQPDEKPLGRQVALFTAVLGLTERLRSVFVPYFRYLLDVIAAQLGGASGETAPRKKKKKKTGSVVVAVGDESSGEPAVVEDTWRLRFKVVQCLHSCFLYDTVSFLDEVRFHRLLPMLVSQLAAQPPAAVSDQLVMQPSKNAASADSKTGSDPFGEAVVAALVQMAVTANNDALWKSLNHQTLMATRSPVMQERLRAIAAVEGLIGRMCEEYLLLLPEALPFLAELLEDPEHQVASATQLLIRKLEELSGESLEQYLKV